MVQTTLLASMVVGIALLAALAVLTSGTRRRALPTVRRPDDAETGFSAAVVRASHRPATWVFAFVVSTLTLGGAAVVFVSGGVPEGLQSVAGLVVGVGLATVAGFYLFYGTVVTARGHGLANAQAVALGSWLLGMGLLVAIVAKLFGAF